MARIWTRTKYLMLDPNTYDIVGEVVGRVAMDDLGMKPDQFARFIDQNKLYKGCILIEDDKTVKKQPKKGRKNMKTKNQMSVPEFMLASIKESMDSIKNPDITTEDLKKELEIARTTADLADSAVNVMNVALKAAQISKDTGVINNIMIGCE